MLSSHTWASLLLLCAVSITLALEGDHSMAAAVDAHQTTRIEGESRGDVAMSGGSINDSDTDVFSFRPEESLGVVKSKGDTAMMGHNESPAMESDPVSREEIEPAPQGDASPVSENEAGQVLVSEGKASPTSQGEISPVSVVGESSDQPEEASSTIPEKVGSVSQVEAEDGGSDVEVPGGGSDSDTEQQSISAGMPTRESYGFSLDEDDRTGKILAWYTTKTKNLFATTTVSRLSTCFSATNTGQCTGRRRKRNLDRNIDATIFDLDSSEDLHGTAADPIDPNYESANQVRSDRDPKKFTVWSTMFSTFTLTSTFYFPGTTVTVSGVCVLPGFGSGCFG